MIFDIFRQNYIIALAADDLAYIMFSKTISVQGSTRQGKSIFPEDATMPEIHGHMWTTVHCNYQEIHASSGKAMV